jgi:hypothetical protein
LLRPLVCADLCLPFRAQRGREAGGAVLNRGKSDRVAPLSSK